MDDVLTELSPGLSSTELDALAHGVHQDPFAVLGPHRVGAGYQVRAFLPGAQSVQLVARRDGAILGRLTTVGGSGVFEGTFPEPLPYRLRVQWDGGITSESEDPYSFSTLLSEFDLHLLAQGRHRELAHCLGAVPMTIDGIAGTRFALWAPNARRVSVVGDFNSWDGRRHPMRLRHAAGVWEIFLPRIGPGERYKFEILDAQGRLLPQKADPIARATELPPATASIVAEHGKAEWTDGAWMQARAQKAFAREPLAVYEVHAGSWLRLVNDARYGWGLLADRLIPYVRELGFTHIELLPIMEHPFGGSWGYQPLSQFAPTARFGSPSQFARFVERCHEQGLGVILDWVPAHFPGDAHGLAQFDGTALYEYADPREGFHRDWNTYIYNFGRNEVRGFLIASALYWLEHFHIDGLRVDAVASMLYRDYSRGPGEWVANRYGGRENLEAIDFLRELTSTVAERSPGALLIAEESTAWPGVTAPTAEGGLGFNFKWNMGWMHDTLRYMECDPIYRPWHHNDLSFGMVYAYSERFILPLSHDEVVYGKKSLLSKMPGDRWQRFANLRAYYGFMWGHPGKKLLFMGAEIAQPTEWNHDGEIPWDLLADPSHQGIQRLVTDLNALLKSEAALYAEDSRPSGFSWVVGDDTRNSVFAFLRHASSPGQKTRSMLVISNFTPVPRHGYRVGVPNPGAWQERLNTDAALYGGSNLGNQGQVIAEAHPAHGHADSLVLTLPPLSTLFLTCS